MKKKGIPARHFFANYYAFRFVDQINFYIVVIIDNISGRSDDDRRCSQREQVNIVDHGTPDQKIGGKILGQSNDQVNSKIGLASESQKK